MLLDSGPPESLQNVDRTLKRGEQVRDGGAMAVRMNRLKLQKHTGVSLLPLAISSEYLIHIKGLHVGEKFSRDAFVDLRYLPTKQFSRQ